MKLNERIEETLSPVFLKPVAKRKRFVFEWLTYLGRKVIEFDAISFRRVSFLMNYDGFSFILLINLPEDFTESPPEYEFRSVYMKNPLAVQIKYVPYHGNWPFQSMMIRAISYLETKYSEFRKVCYRQL